jgi:dethiobiotin synthetase
MSRGIFVTGTDTGVGKTVVTRALVRAFVRRGIRVGAVKPVESGTVLEAGRQIPLDARALKNAAGMAGEIDEVIAYAFQSPVSPHLAAAREDRTIEAGPITALLERWAGFTDLVVAEGAGGLLVPLSDELVYGDVIAASGFRLLVVAPNQLGAINTTLLTLEAARARNIDVAGVILNRTPERDLGNRKAIERHGRVPILGEFPTAEKDGDDVLAELAETHLDLGCLL